MTSDDKFEKIEEQLLKTLAEAAQLLQECGEDRWARWLDSDRQRILVGDRDGLEHLLSAFGGMGSINDLLIHPANGHPVTEELAPEINDRLRAMLSLCSELAGEMRDALE
ncbi:MAG: hypothetical protein GEU99_12085 [Luteitalea sp.]|nr:hypothetical protein [Luteitalea sp.]